LTALSVAMLIEACILAVSFGGFGRSVFPYKPPPGGAGA
jgi:hypothetical protein